MKTSLLLLGIVGLAAMMWAAPAAADHNGPARPESGLQLDADIGERAFHLGARLVLAERAWGAWLWGESGPGGTRLDGRLEGGDRPLDFSFDARRARDFFERWLPKP